MLRVLPLCAGSLCMSLVASAALSQQVTQTTLEGPSGQTEFTVRVQGSDNVLYFCRPDTSVVAGQVVRFCRPASSFGTAPATGLTGFGGITGNLGLLGLLGAVAAISAASGTN